MIKQESTKFVFLFDSGFIIINVVEVGIRFLFVYDCSLEVVGYENNRSSKG